MSLYKLTRVAFYDLCANTGLCGFKYLIPKISLIRRLCWFVVCIVFSCLTLYQLWMVVYGYWSNPVKVVLGKDYPETVDFPAVIICNTMIFRVSHVKPHSPMNEALAQLYSSPKLNVKVTENPSIAETLKTIEDANDYFRSVAHQKEDMILSCSWQNEPCSADNFTMVVTEHGICYSFPIGNRPLTVGIPGKDFGLQLVLNVATYEEMNGPHNVFGALGEPPSAKAAIYTKTGEFTVIGLTQKQVTYLEGRHCQSGLKLKFFDSYTRSACNREKAFEEVNKTCGCYPCLATESRLTADLCPQECSAYHFTPVISSGKISWDQLETIYPNASDIQAKLERELRKATEIAMRYRPKNIQVWQPLFQQLLKALDDVTIVIRQSNSLTIDIPLNPATSSPPDFKTIYDKFVMEIYQPTLESFDVELAKLNKTFRQTNEAITILGGGEQGADAELLKKTVARHPELFSISSGQTYLNTISSLVNSLEKLDSVKANLRKGNLTGFFIGNGTTILTSELRSDLHESLTLLYRLINLPNDTLIKTELGCLQQPISTYTSHTRLAPSNKESLLDVYLCFQHFYSSPDTKMALSQEIGSFINLIPRNVLDPKHQADICEGVLCKIFKGTDGFGCRISTAEGIKIARILGSMMRKAFGQCEKMLVEAKLQMEQFSRNYSDVILPEYRRSVGNATQFAKANLDLHQVYKKSLFTIDEDVNYLKANLSGYLNNSLNYQTVSMAMVDFYDRWVDHRFGFEVNEATKKLRTSLNDLQSMTTALSHLQNISAEQIGIYSVVAKSVLWPHNFSDFFVQQSFSGIASLQTDMEMLSGNISLVANCVFPAVKKLVAHSDKFIHHITVDQQFYDKNLLAVNIHMQEISTETIEQKIAYGFWTLIADLGGAGSFWLGLNCVVCVEMIDLIVRYFGLWMFKFFRPPKKPSTLAPFNNNLESPESATKLLFDE